VEQLFIIILVALVAGVNWMMKRDSTDEGESTDSEPADLERREERVRKFMDALGVPDVPKVPRPRIQAPRVRIQTQVKTAPPRRRVPDAPVAPAPKSPWLETGFPPIVHAPLPPPVVREMEAAPVVVAEPVRAPVILQEVAQESSSPALPPPAPVVASASKRQARAEVIRSLRSPDTLRLAIVAREILGPPRGMQPLFGNLFAARS
jgi:hypothetical protein